MPKLFRRSPNESVQTTTRRAARPGALAMLGPAFVAAVAYVDPGNFATNISGGAEFGYLLLWVIVAANLHGDAHPEPLGEDGHRDRAQPPGAVPRALPAAGHLGAVGAGRARRDGDRPRGVRRRGDRAQPAVRHPAVPGGPHHRRRLLRGARPPAPRPPPLRGSSSPGCSASILLGFLYDTLRIGFDAGDAAQGLHPGLRRHRQRAARHRHPRRDGHAARHLPALGADPAPDRRDDDRGAAPLLRFQRIDVTIAMGLAGIINMAMLIVAASLFHDARR